MNYVTGALNGYVWSAYCDWISLSNAVAYVQADYLNPGPLAPDGLPIPWLLANFGTTNVNANADPTGKGNTIGEDYLAGTDPNNVNSVFRITAETFTSTNSTLTWNGEPTRLYYVFDNTNLTTVNWRDSGLGLIVPSVGATTTTGFPDTNRPAKFYRVGATLPLPEPSR